MSPSSERRGPPSTVRLRRYRGEPAPRSNLETLVAALIDEMTAAFRRGERPQAEAYLARYPEFRDRPEAAAELIYEEVCLRQEHGESVDAEEVMRRFPQWRAKLEVLFDCQRLLAAPSSEWPSAGETLGDFLLVSEIGRGANGSVFLAMQRSLGSRPVVLKLAPADGDEHLRLARLQHTHVVPIHSVQEFPERRLRALCMPYFGGAALGQILEALREIPPAKRRGRDLLDALDRLQAAPVALAPRRPARAALAAASYTRAVCWLVACLAEAMHYAHESGLLHLDLKPSNVLLTADGEPMLLDFHVARGPLQAGTTEAGVFGGTPDYMSPEQGEAMEALDNAQPVPRPVDERSDIYSLGVLLYEALTGEVPRSHGRGSLRCANTEVTAGLEDVTRKCLATDPRRRYTDMASLADDLHRHLNDLPLRGVSNRSLHERWRKWRRRRPSGLPAAATLAAVFLASVGVAVGAVGHFVNRTEQARSELGAGRSRLLEGRADEAVLAFERGLTLARGVPLQGELVGELAQGRRKADEARTEGARARMVRDLHTLTDRVRFLSDAVTGSSDELRRLGSACASLWGQRERILAHVGDSAVSRQARDDLLDLGILYAHLLRSEPASAAAAETVLQEAEDTFGPNPAIDTERRLYGVASPAVRPGAVDTVWAHYALGRSLMRGGELSRAAVEFQRAVELQPAGLWPNFYWGVCAYRLGRFEEAAAAFGVCIGAEPLAAACYYNRAAALAALGHNVRALADCERALTS